MIVSFRNKKLEKLFVTGSTRGVNPKHVPKLMRVLSMLDIAREPRDLEIPGFHTHALSGTLKNFWSISISGNWRVIYRFADGDVELVDYLDYH